MQKQVDITDEANLIDWQLPYGLPQAGMLHAEVGGREMRDIARRLQARRPHLFPAVYDAKVYSFRSSGARLQPSRTGWLILMLGLACRRWALADVPRTRDSALAFAKGLFGEDSASPIVRSLPQNEDWLLRFFKMCPKYDIAVKKNETLYLAYGDLAALQEVRGVISGCGIQVDWRFAQPPDSICCARREFVRGSRPG